MADEHDDGAKRKNFTSWKLDILDAMSCDPKMQGKDFQVAFRLIQHMNSRTRECFPSMAIIAAQADCDVKTVERSLRRLERISGWIERERPNRNKSYLYRFVETRWNEVADGRAEREQEAKERTDRERKERFGQTKMSSRNIPDPTELSSPDPTKQSQLDQTVLTGKHLNKNYLKITPEESQGLEEVVVEGQTGNQTNAYLKAKGG